jgi:hypothetical protein
MYPVKIPSRYRLRNVRGVKIVKAGGARERKCRAAGAIQRVGVNFAGKEVAGRGGREASRGRPRKTM